MILIWSNTGEWGGVDVLIMRFAEFLRSRGAKFVIAEPPASRLRRDLPWADFVDIADAASLNGQITSILMPSVAKIRDMEFPWQNFCNIPILGWGVQPNSLLTSFVPLASRALSRLGYGSVRPLLSLMPRHRELVSGLFKELLDGRSLALMDDAHRRALAYFYPELQVERALTVPVPAPLGSLITPRSPLPSEPLCVGYFGRIDSIKWSALEPFIRHSLATLAQKRAVKLVAVSEGEGVSALDATCRSARVGLELHGFMPNQEARRFLRENTHFAVSMGTSALDLAAAGHPCMVLDTAVRQSFRPQERFRFIHEAEGWTLGEFRDFPDYLPGLRSFDESISLLEEQDLSTIAREYVAMRHDPETAFSALHSGLLAAKTTVGMIAPLAIAIEQSIIDKNRYYGWLRRSSPTR